jgi:alkaline phosphatase D
VRGAVGAPFRHGVASGDPLADRVVLWTRVSDAGDAAVPVEWWVREAGGRGRAVATGEAMASPEHDHTVHVDVDGLEPGHWYEYGFRAGSSDGPVGRTRTAPAGPTDHLRLGLVSCASWVCGWFTAYERLARRDVDLVVHVGDYIYDGDTTRARPVRAHDPAGRCVTLAQYRARYAQYRADPDLQALHARAPLVAVWDDHEVASNAWRDGATDHDPETDGPWEDRRAAATQAWSEWLPVRRPDPVDPLRIYRALPFGDLVDLVMLDVRLIGRDEPVKEGKRASATVPDRDRSLLGDQQRAWLHEVLRSSTARWRLVGNQVMLAPLRAVPLPRPLQRLLGRGLVGGGVGVNPGQWDGYPEEREALLRFVADNGVRDVVVLTGDIHSSWAAELTVEPDEGTPVAVEVVGPSVTTDAFSLRAVPSLPGAVPLVARLVRRANPHHRWFELRRHGYVVVDVTPERLRADWWHVDSIREPRSDEHRAASFEVVAGTPRWVRVG